MPNHTGNLRDRSRSSDAKREAMARRSARRLKSTERFLSLAFDSRTAF